MGSPIFLKLDTPSWFCSGAEVKLWKRGGGRHHRTSGAAEESRSSGSELRYRCFLLFTVEPIRIPHNHILHSMYGYNWQLLHISSSLENENKMTILLLFKVVALKVIVSC
uniref:Uncharacterized protein n=1 Tax=Physcomitrium patens TaxID=3218 RepID=A0A2K1K3D6_PHYPA|nr:hypothetical protein PHYPA_012767 [Physcomitrium patens]